MSRSAPTTLAAIARTAVIGCWPRHRMAAGAPARCRWRELADRHHRRRYLQLPGRGIEAAFPLTMLRNAPMSRRAAAPDVAGWVRHDPRVPDPQSERAASVLACLGRSVPAMGCRWRSTRNLQLLRGHSRKRRNRPRWPVTSLPLCGRRSRSHRHRQRRWLG